MKNVTEFISELKRALKKNFSMYDKVWVERLRKFDSELMFNAIIAISLEREGSNYRLLYDRLFSFDITSAKEFSASSFSKARRKLPFELFVDLSQWVYSFHTIPKSEKWLGLSIFAIDGTVIDLPDELEFEGFDNHQNEESEQPQALASVLYDLQKGMVYDAIVSQHFDERLNAKVLLKSLPDDSLLICDRGYNSFEFFYDAEEAGVKLLLRMPEAQAPVELRAFIKSNSLDEIVSMTLSKPSERKMIRRGYKPRPVTVRAIKYYIDGQRFLAITTLLDDEVSRSTLASLYWCRWDIEECFKLEKEKLGLENFRSKHLQGILQEFWAIQLLQNIARALIICQSNFKSKKSDRTEISMFGVCKLLKTHLFKLLIEVSGQLAERIARLERAIQKITHKYRGGRTTPRGRLHVTQ
jgi:hypothetical protein